jgi:hypothetical protein
MSVNQRFGINQEKTKSLGKNFHTIDFDFNDAFSKTDYLDKNNRIPVGAFYIGNSQFNISMAELERIGETIENAKDVLFKKYKLGRMASR